MTAKYIILTSVFILSALTLCLSSAGKSSAADKDAPGADRTHPAEQINSDNPTHKEIEPIGLTPETEFANLSTFCITAKGNLLACDSEAEEIKRIGPDGKLLDTWKLEFSPFSIVACPDGTIYVAGPGTVAKLDAKGKILKTVRVETEDPDEDDDWDNEEDEDDDDDEDEDDEEEDPFESKSSGIEATEKDVFVCFGSGWSTRSTSSIVRFDRNLNNPKTIADQMHGCCQRLDIVARDGILYVAENARHRVVKLDRDGKILSKWGQRDRKNIEGFGSCCNPMNLFFNSEGVLYTAESGLGRIKRYSADGRFLGLVGHIGTTRFNQAGRLAASCSNIAVAVSQDQSRIYVLDFAKNLIRIMVKIDADSAKVKDKDKDNSTG